jgi:hypothetical protein
MDSAFTQAKHLRLGLAISVSESRNKRKPKRSGMSILPFGLPFATFLALN